MFGCRGGLYCGQSGTLYYNERTVMAIIENIDLTPAQRREVCAVLKKFFPDIEIWAYGSRVKWNARPNSDLDLVAFLPDGQKEKLFACREAFDESSLPFKVDLFSWNDIPENFQKQIKENYAIIQTTEWKYLSAREFCTRVADGTHATPKPSVSGKKLVTSKNIVSGKLSLEDCYFISQDDFDEINQRSKVDLGDVLLSMIGTVGASCVIDTEPDFAIKNVALLKNKDLCHGKWLNYYLSTPEGQQAIRERLRGTTQQYIPLEEVRNLPIKVPRDSCRMEKIVDILSAFDDKIELNRKMCKTLEAMAQALFKSWFVDFEPVKAKIAAIEAGRDPELAAMMTISGKTESELVEMRSAHPDAYADLAHIASLFPAAMVEDPELEQIPDWKIYQFNDILTEEKEKCGERDIPEFSVTDTGIHPRDDKFKKSLSASKNRNKVLRKNQLVFGMSREILNWGIMEEEIGGVSSVYNIFSVSHEINIEYLKMFIANKSIYFIDLIKPAAREGQSIDKKVLMQKRISYPDEQLFQCWIEKHMSLQEKQKGIFAMQNILTTQQALSLSTLISASNSTERYVAR